MNVSFNSQAANFNTVTIGDLTIWFSYETPIAFRVIGQPTIVRQNVWSTTTGKHLNRIDGGDKIAKERRVDSETFNRLLAAAVA